MERKHEENDSALSKQQRQAAEVVMKVELAKFVEKMEERMTVIAENAFDKTLILAGLSSPMMTYTGAAIGFMTTIYAVEHGEMRKEDADPKAVLAEGLMLLRDELRDQVDQSYEVSLKMARDKGML